MNTGQSVKVPELIALSHIVRPVSLFRNNYSANLSFPSSGSRYHQIPSIRDDKVRQNNVEMSKSTIPMNSLLLIHLVEGHNTGISNKLMLPRKTVIHAVHICHVVLPIYFRDVKLEESYFNRDVEKAFLTASKELFEEKTKPSLKVANQVGNMYTPSVYSSLCSYISG